MKVWQTINIFSFATKLARNCVQQIRSDWSKVCACHLLWSYKLTLYRKAIRTSPPPHESTSPTSTWKNT